MEKKKLLINITDSFKQRSSWRSELKEKGIEIGDYNIEKKEWFLFVINTRP
jgi:hypothetical protein